MDASKAAAALGRRGGKAGTGAAKVRGDADHYRALRAKRPAPQVYESRGEWGGYTVREGLRGWVVEWWSRQQGERTGARVVLLYKSDYPRTTQLDHGWNGYLTSAEVIQAAAWDALRDGYGSPIRILRRGHVVR